MRRRTAILLLIILIGSRPESRADELQLSADVSRRQIYEGESVDLTLHVSGADKELAKPDLSGIRDATVEALGSNSRSSRTVSWINGRRQDHVQRARVFAYRLTPTGKGVFHPGPITLRHQGQTYTTDAPDVRITGIEQQDDVILTLSSTRDAVLIDEPFTISLSVSMRMLPGTYRGTDPILPADPPHLACDFLNPVDIRGLKGPDIRTFLQERLLSSPRTPGFLINEFTTRSDSFMNAFSFDFDGFGRPQRAKFKLDRAADTGTHADRWVYTISMTYLPTQEGSHTFGPAVFKGKVVTGVEAGNAQIREVYTIGPAVTVRVLPPPDEGRPECYVGTLGKDLTATAHLDTQICKVGDPLKLTLDITGPINKDTLRPPVLGLQSNLTERFRIYDDAVRTEPLPDGKRFTYRIRPLEAGTYEFPGVQVGYYDTEQRVYVVRTTDPIPLQANASAQVRDDAVIDTVTNRVELASQTQQRLLTRRRDDAVSAITLDPAGGRTPSRRSARHWLMLLLPGPLLCLVAALGMALWLRLPAVAVRQRRRLAWPKTRPRLQHALHRERRHPREARAEAVEATRHYLADRFDASRQGMAPNDVRHLLQQQNMADEIVQAVVAPLSALFDAAYAPEPPAGREGSETDHIRALTKALAALEKAAAQRGGTA